VKRNDPQQCLYWIIHGADPNFFNAVDAGLTPLHYAARRAAIEVAMVLLHNGANVHAVDDNHWTPLHHCAALGHTQTAALLFKNGCLIDGPDKDGKTPVDIAIATHHPDIVTLLRLATLAMEEQRTTGKLVDDSFASALSSFSTSCASVEEPTDMVSPLQSPIRMNPPSLGVNLNTLKALDSSQNIAMTGRGSKVKKARYISKDGWSMEDFIGDVKDIDFSSPLSSRSGSRIDSARSAPTSSRSTPSLPKPERDDKHKEENDGEVTQETSLETESTQFPKLQRPVSLATLPPVKVSRKESFTGKGSKIRMKKKILSPKGSAVLGDPQPSATSPENNRTSPKTRLRTPTNEIDVVLLNLETVPRHRPRQRSVTDPEGDMIFQNETQKEEGQNDTQSNTTT